MADFISRLTSRPQSQHVWDTEFNGVTYFIFGSVFIKIGSDYYGICNAVDNRLSFQPHFSTNSILLLGKSSNPLGPFKIQSIILDQRDQSFWDGGRISNASIVKIGAKYVVYYVGSTYSGTIPDPAIPSTHLTGSSDARAVESGNTQQVGMIVANSIDGEWTRYNSPILTTGVTGELGENQRITNPAACLLSNGNVVIAYRTTLSGSRVIGLASSVTPLDINSYNRVDNGVSIVPEGVGGSVSGDGYEDPCLWVEDGELRMICKDFDGALNGGVVDGSLYLASSNEDGTGSGTWSLGSPNPLAYSKTIGTALPFDDGYARTFTQRERPSVFIDPDDNRVYLYNGASESGYGNDELRNMVEPLVTGVATDSLISYWPLNNNPLIDSVSGDAILHNGGTLVRNYGISFTEEEDSYAQLNYIGDPWNLRTPGTISFFVRLTKTPSSYPRTVLEFGTPVGDPIYPTRGIFQIRVEESAFLIGRFGQNNTTNSTNSELGIRPTNDKFHHIAVTHDGFAWQLYVDGVLQGYLSGSTGLHHVHRGWLLGKSNTPGRSVACVISHLRVYNYALPLPEINRLSAISNSIENWPASIV